MKPYYANLFEVVLCQIGFHRWNYGAQRYASLPMIRHCERCCKTEVAHLENNSVHWHERPVMNEDNNAE